MGRGKFGRIPIVGIIMFMFVILFGMFWTFMAHAIGAPFWFFGLFFVAIGVASMVSTLRGSVNTAGTSGTDRASSEGHDFYGNDRAVGSDYCPYCGARAGLDFEYCKKCGRKIS